MRLALVTVIVPVGIAFANGPGQAKAPTGAGTIAGVVKHRSVASFPTVVFIDQMPGATFAPPRKPARIDQKNKTFIPRVLPILVGTTVEFTNSDPFEHNVNSPDGEGYDLGNWKYGDSRSRSFTKPGVYVQLCRMHPEMSGYVVVLETPHFVLTTGDGRFHIPDVPPGAWKLRVWNERLKPRQTEKTFEVTVTAGKDTRVDLDL